MSVQRPSTGTADDIKALARRTKRRLTEKQKTQSASVSIPSMSGLNLPVIEEPSSKVASVSPVLWPEAGDMPSLKSAPEGSVAAPIPSIELDSGKDSSAKVVAVAATDDQSRAAAILAKHAQPKGTNKGLVALIGMVAVASIGVGGFLALGTSGSSSKAAPVTINAPVVDNTPPAAPPATAPEPEAVEDEADTGGMVADQADEPAEKPVAKAEPKVKKTDNKKRAAAAPKANGASGSMDHRKLKPKKMAEAKKPVDNSGAEKSIAQLLDEAAGKDDLPVYEEEKEAEPSKKDISRSDVKSAMGKVHGQASGCYSLYEKAGTVQIKFTVDPDTGSISKAVATGSFAGTDTGKCVAKAVKKAKFPRYAGAPKTFTYPFLLSP